MIQSLQSLRGIFALFIFFHHFSFTPWGEIVFGAGGDSGVAFFFVLSGFVLMLSYTTKLKKGKPEDPLGIFIGKRLSKIYPLHLLCFVYFITAYGVGLNKCNILNPVLLQSWIPLSDVFFSGNAVGWCLSDFLFFYIMFPFLAPRLNRNPKGFISTFICLAVIYILLIIPFIPEKYVLGIVYVNPATRLLDFMLGMILCAFFLKIDNQKHNTNKAAKEICATVFLVLTIIIWYYIPTRWQMSFLWWPCMSMIVIAFSLGGGSKIMKNKLLVAFGDISFTFYLIHVLVFETFDKVMEKLGIEVNLYIRFIVILAITVFAAYLISKYFVNPIEKAIRKRLSRPANN